MIFIMVASSMVNNVYAGDEKLFVNVGKLSGKANYTIWVGALSTAFLGATVAAVVSAGRLFEDLLNRKVKHIEDSGEALKEFQRAEKLNNEDMEEANRTLFRIVFEAMNDSLSALKTKSTREFFGIGSQLVLAIFGKFDQPVGTAQTQKLLTLMSCTQLDEESAEDYGNRLQNLNAEITTGGLDDAVLTNIMLKGLTSADLQEFLLKMMSQLQTMDSMIDAVIQYDIQLAILDDGFPLQANLAMRGARGRGRGRGIGRGIGRGPPFGKGGPGGKGKGKGNGNGNVTCFGCGIPGHQWRQCFKLYETLRPATLSPAAHQAFNSQRQQIMQNATAERRQMFLGYAAEIGDPGLQNIAIPANLAQAQAAQQPAQQEFPGLVAQVQIENADQSDRFDRHASYVVEMTVLGLGVICKALAPAKRGAKLLFQMVMAVGLALFSLAVAVGAFSLMIGLVLNNLPGTAALSMHPAGCAAPGWHNQQVSVSPQAFHVSHQSLAQAESLDVPAFLGGRSDGTVSVHWDNCAAAILMNVKTPFVTWDPNPVTATITSCFGQKVRSEGSGMMNLTFLKDNKLIVEKVHAYYVPHLPQPLIGATALMTQYNVSTHMSAKDPHAVLSNGKKIPLRADRDVLVCDSIVLDVKTHPLRHTLCFDASVEYESPVEGPLKPSNMSPQEVSRFKLWTRRTCGLNATAVSKLSKNSVGCDCPSTIPSSCKTLSWYASGLAGKMRGGSHPSSPTRASTFREVVSFDYLEFKIRGKKFHSLNFVDHKTTYGRCYVTDKRSNAADFCLRFVNETDRFVCGSTVIECQHDNAMEFLSKSFAKRADLSGIIKVTAAPYQHQSMGQVERFNQTIQRMVTTILDDSGLPVDYAKYAIHYAEYVYNRVPVQHLGYKSRYEVVTGRVPDLRSLYCFGSQCKVLKPEKYRKHKFDTHVWDCTLLGWNTYSHGWLLIHNDTKRVFTSPDIVVDESVRPFRNTGGNRPPVISESHSSSSVFATEGPDSAFDVDQRMEDEPVEVVDPDDQDEDSRTPTIQRLPSGWHAEHRNGSHLSRPYSVFHGPHGEYAESVQAAHRIADSTESPPYRDFPNDRDARSGNEGIRRSSRLAGKELPAINILTGDTHETQRVERDGELVFEPPRPESSELDAMLVDVSIPGGSKQRMRWKTALLAFAATISAVRTPFGLDIPTYVSCVDSFNASLSTFDMGLQEPSSLREAQMSPNWDVPQGYKEATETELNRWTKMGVYQDVKSIPERAKALGLRFVYTVKTDDIGNFKKAKCRVVVLGHRAVWGEHYLENCATTMKWPSFRTCLSLAISSGAHLFQQWDTSTAFLYAELEPGTECYVKVPPELSQFMGVDHVSWKIVKAAYGLPSAPREFQRHVGRTLRKCKLIPSKVDPNIFCRREGSEFIFVCTWVDDFAVMSNSTRLYNEVRDVYFSVYDCSEDPLKFMLGVHIEVDTKVGHVKLHSRKHIDNMLARFGTPSRNSLIPATSEFAELANSPLPEVGSDEYFRLRERAIRYRSLVPSMLYASTTTRPDVCYAIGVLCRALDNPSERHLVAAEVVLAYLASSREMGVVYDCKHDFSLSARYSPLKDGLIGLSDSDWSTGKSISGFLLILCGGAIVWASKKQPVTSLSSTEAEYYAASVCGAEILYIRHLLQDLGTPESLPTPLLIDNSACVSLGKHWGTVKRVKHIDRRISFLNDYVELGDIVLHHVSTRDNVADMFTKPLEKSQFLPHRNSIVS